MDVVRTLADDDFAPITSAIGFLEAPLPAVADAIASWRAALQRRTSVTRLTDPIPSVLTRLEPLVGGARPRELVVSNGASWTAYFDCGLRGPDAVSTVGHLAEVLGCQGIAIRTTPHVVDSTTRSILRMGAVQFEMFGPLRTDFINYVRTVSCIYDGSRWRFDVNGTEQWFEEIAQYDVRRVRDRFTSEMLERYCRALGIDPFAVEAYGRDAILIESELPTPVGGKVMTLQEVQRWLSIAPGAAAEIPG
jgi:hypothetical protein